MSMEHGKASNGPFSSVLALNWTTLVSVQGRTELPAHSVATLLSAFGMVNSSISSSDRTFATRSPHLKVRDSLTL